MKSSIELRTVSCCVNSSTKREVFDRIKDGVLLCKLINKAQEGTIDERVINKKENMNIFQQVENLNLAISAAKSIGLNCIGLNYDAIMDGKNYIMVLGYHGLRVNVASS